MKELFLILISFVYSVGLAFLLIRLNPLGIPRDDPSSSFRYLLTVPIFLIVFLAVFILLKNKLQKGVLYIAGLIGLIFLFFLFYIVSRLFI